MKKGQIVAAPKIHRCKVGTIPGLVVLKAGTKPSVDKKIEFRNPAHGSKWQFGRVTKVNDDGYFFIDLI